MFVWHHARLFVLLGFVFALSFPGSARGEVSIRLDGVPDTLCFPLPEGTNQLLTATVKDGAVKSVWLAPSAATSRPASRLMLTKVGEDEYRINLAGREVHDLLRPHGADGEFRVFAETADGTEVRSISVRYRMYVLPDRLDFLWDQAKMTIHQRTSKALLGSEGSVRVRLGDITRGQVLVSIYGPNGKPIVDMTSVAEGDTLTFSLAEEAYVLRLDKLVNRLLGDDYGVFSLMPSQVWEGKRIDGLLELISTSGLTFIRNGQELSGEVFAGHLRQKYEYYGPKNASVGEFIDKVASRSLVSGEPYRVKLRSGDVVEAGPWLREEIAKLPEPQKGGQVAAPRP